MTGFIYMITNNIDGKQYRGEVHHAYGFCWRFHESVETNCKPEDELLVEAQRISDE